MRHISRVETRNTIGWQVRMMRNRKSHSKFFADGKHGGKNQALLVAQRYRDTLVDIAPPSREHEARTDRDTGIHLEKQGTYRAWVAQWVDEKGKKRSKKFNIKKYGNLRAQQMARNTRLKGLARMDIEPPKRIPTLEELLG